MRKHVILWVVLTGLLIRNAGAYDLDTHRNVSRRALAASVVPNSFSLDSDLAGNTALLQFVPFFSKVQKIPKWVADGAADEDAIFPWDSGDNPTVARFRDHFYNPLNGSGYPLPPPLAYPAPDWALEDEGDCVFQTLSWKDARDRYYDYFTKETPAARENGLALTFYTLGHVLHLIEDMASPQHTRMDSHGTDYFFRGNRRLGSYECYTQDRLTDEMIGVYDQAAGQPYGRQSYGAVYPETDVTSFYRARDFWHSPTGKGLADYANGGFVTTGTNFTAPLSFGLQPHPGFPSPPNGADAEIETETVGELLGPKGPNQPLDEDAEVDFIVTHVEDRLRGDSPFSRTSTYGIFDAELQGKMKSPNFTLNRLNFEAAWQLLLPRAIGYSAGLLNYFFRGAFSVHVTNAEMGQYAVRNDTAEAMNGTFQLYYDDAQGNRHHFGTDQTISVPASIPGRPPGTEPFQVPFPPDPTVNDCTVVFRGTLGLESGAVAATYTHVVSGPFVHVFGDGSGVSGGSASGLRNDLASFTWGGSCSRDLNDGTWLWCPLELSSSSGGLSGRQASVPAPDFPDGFPTMCAECCVGLCVTDSHGGSACDYYCFPIAP
jgi:hypothetical protein